MHDRQSLTRDNPSYRQYAPITVKGQPHVQIGFNKRPHQVPLLSFDRQILVRRAWPLDPTFTIDSTHLVVGSFLHDRLHTVIEGAGATRVVGPTVDRDEANGSSMPMFRLVKGCLLKGRASY